jgi:hypothetical protein
MGSAVLRIQQRSAKQKLLEMHLVDEINIWVFFL